MKKILAFLEVVFWAVSALLTIVGAFGMLFKGSYSLIQDFGTLKSVLTTEMFYAVIAFELFQMARVRLEKRSHKIVLYHFIFMATLTLGREIFLVHNLSIWVIVGFSIMVLVYVLYWRWNEQSGPNAKLFDSADD